MSRLKLTAPGTVFVEPGDSFRMPVEARALCAVARRWECRMSLLARSKASVRLDRGVVPVCASAPLNVSLRSRAGLAKRQGTYRVL